jgi:hypothetical protein
MEIAGLFFSVCQTRRSPRRLSQGCMVSEVGSRNGIRIGTSPSTTRGWKNPSYVMVSAWPSLKTMWKKRGLMSKDICAFLASTYLQSCKKKVNLTFCLPSYMPKINHRF